MSSICLPPDFGTTQRQTPALDRPRWRGGGGGSNSGGITRSPVSPQHPRPRAEALTRDLSASLTCSARFEIFLAGAASRSSSRKQSAQLTFLRPLPILRLVKGISSQTVRGEGPPRRRVGPGSGELKCAPPAGRPQLHSGSLGSCVCTQPRPPPHPLPRRWPPARPPARPTGLFLAGPITSGRRDCSEGRGSRREQQAGWETWPGVALSHCDNEHFPAAGRAPPREGASFGGRPGWGGGERGSELLPGPSFELA